MSYQRINENREIENLSPAGYWLKDWLQQPEQLGMLIDSDWMDGGCRVLAEALVQVIPNASLKVIGSIQELAPSQHVVVELNHQGQLLYLDGDGLSTSTELLVKMAELEGVKQPWIGDYNAELLDSRGVLGDTDISNQLVERIKDVHPLFMQHERDVKTYPDIPYEFMRFSSEQAMGVYYALESELDDPEDVLAMLPGEHGQMGTCTNCAHYVLETLGTRPGKGMLYGFTVDNNPSVTHRMIEIACGHDFAVIDNRYIIDPWISHYTGEEAQFVYDMKKTDDHKKIREIFGDPECWSKYCFEAHKFIEPEKRKASISAGMQP